MRRSPEARSPEEGIEAGAAALIDEVNTGSRGLAKLCSEPPGLKGRFSSPPRSLSSPNRFPAACSGHSCAGSAEGSVEVQR